MKAIPLGLISSIIFSIVLAEKHSDLEFTAGCFPLYRKKTKKNDKIDEPVEDTGYDPDIPDLQFIDEYYPTVMEICKIPKPIVGELFTSEDDDTTVDEATGFLRRKYDPLRIGRYFRPYEEAFEYRNSYIFIPFKDIHHYNEMVACGKALFHSAPPKIPEKQELLKKRELSEKQELLAEEKLDEVASHRGDGKNEEICEQSNLLLCTNPKEAVEAEKLMNEAITHLEHHATDKDGYEFCKRYDFYSMVLYKKKHEGHIVQKINLKYYTFDKYNDTINEVWYPGRGNSCNDRFVKRKIARMYNPNLVIIQQRYKDSAFGRWKYFYALAAKFEISNKKTIIVMTSANINDHNPSGKEYKNTIIENANSFKIDIDSEDDIRSGKLKKTFVNIAGYIIEKKLGYVDVTYVESIDGHSFTYLKRVIMNGLSCFFPVN
ncbi:Acidic phosphoprotein precursor PCEMA1, putative [Plasmodium chabaudi adami]|uniref:Acidic phosphoprotein PCEMA1, putative n=1 Tax=Plasmodium chabaudi adami TaxID=5826 RepID=A0A1D3L822_PLACE|nr:Acidic phosphoprotein precursor PCEMA1, putative [Plasmodium chabaudi adami]